MPPRLKAVFEQIALFWAQLPTAKRLALVTLTVGALLTVLAVSWWNSQIRYGYLYTDLSTEDAAAIRPPSRRRAGAMSAKRCASFSPAILAGRISRSCNGAASSRFAR